MSEMAARTRKHFTFSSQETTQVLITALIIGFGLTLWTGWGVFDIVEGNEISSYIANLLIVAIMALVGLIIHVSAQKFIAVQLGYEAMYSYWLTGLFIHAFFAFVTGGWLPLFFPGSISLKAVPKLRIGVFRGGIMHRDLAIVAAAGPIANILTVGLLAIVYWATLSPIMFAFIILNLLIGLFSLIPMPTFEGRLIKGVTPGLHIFIASRITLIFMLSTVMVYTILILIVNIFSYLLAIAIGGIIAYSYYQMYEKAKK